MKKIYILLLLTSWLFQYYTQQQESENTSLSFEQFYCEYQPAPLGIDNPAPRLTWIVRSDQPKSYQTAYQLLVASSASKLEKNIGDIWDSGKIISGQSAQVPYDGPALRSGVEYFWKARIWDNEDRPSPYSPVHSWEMGLLTPEDWRAEWISAPRLFDWSKRDQQRKQLPKNAPRERDEPAPIFRTDFSVTAPIQRARLYISGLGYNEVYLNGKKVGDNLLDPAFTAYDKTVLYTTYDITKQLAKGPNAIGVMLGNGWYNMFSRGVWSFDRSPWIDDPAFILQLHIFYEDGTEDLIASDETWKSHPGPITFNAIRQGEEYDARQLPAGWSSPGFDDQHWHPVRKVRGPEGQLTAQALPPIQIMEVVDPIDIYRTAQGTWVCDFGQNMAGFVDLAIEATAGQRMTIKYGEKLYSDGTVDQSNIDGLVADTPFQTDVYITKDGSQQWHPRFVYHGFQYVEIDGFPGIPTADNIKACLVSTSFEKKGSFESSSALLNQIQHNAEWSFLSNFHGYPTDCPHREKNGWTGDAQLASDMALYNFRVETAYDKWVNDIVDSQLPSGMVSAIVPTGGWGYYWGNGPAWDYALIALPWKTYLYSGDQQMLEKYYPYMKKYLDFLATTTNDYIIRWGLGDWVPLKTQTPAELITTAYFYHDAVLLGKIADVLGNAGDIAKYGELATKIKEAFITKYYDEKTGIVGNGSQTSMACAVFFGLPDSTKVQSLVDRLTTSISTDELNLDVGVLGAKFVPNVLAEHGEVEAAYQMIHTTDFPGWGHWVSRGATTLWEDWNGENSRNHIFFGDVSAWFYKYLAGIQPDESAPGFRHFFINPYFPDDLEWVKASVDTYMGRISSHWEKTGEGLRLRAEVPFNSTATFMLPAKSSIEVRLMVNGKEKSISDIEVSSVSGKQSMQLGSGTYIIRIIQ